MSGNNLILSQEIITKIVILGHFIHYKMGGKVGRRRIFSILLKHGEEMPQKKMQEILDVRSGSLSEILAKTEEDGYIEKIRNKQDKRNYNIRLTASGKVEAIRVQQEYEERVEQMLSCLAEEEKEKLYIQLDKLMKHWNALEMD